MKMPTSPKMASKNSHWIIIHSFDPFSRYLHSSLTFFVYIHSSLTLYNRFIQKELFVLLHWGEKIRACFSFNFVSWRWILIQNHDLMWRFSFFLSCSLITVVIYKLEQVNMLRPTLDQLVKRKTIIVKQLIFVSPGWLWILIARVFGKGFPSIQSKILVTKLASFGHKKPRRTLILNRNMPGLKLTHES